MHHQRGFLIVCLMLLSTFGDGVSAGELGEIPAGGFHSPEGDTRFSPAAGAKPLNNLVFELLNRESPGHEQQSFRNPREGWIYVRVSSDDHDRSPVLLLDDKVVGLKLFEGHWETMRYLAEGPHTVQIPSEDKPVTRLEVRAVGELVYATYGHNPHIQETGHYTWDFLRRHCLDHYNSIIGADTLAADGTSTHEAEIREWTSQGKRWFTSESVPYDANTVDEAYNHWAKSAGMQHPLMSGIWADEFGVGEKYGKKTSEMYPIWIEAIKRLRANPEFAERTFYAYSPSRLLPEERFREMFPFMQTLVESGYASAPEWYLPESYSRPGREIVETKDLLAEFSPGWEQASRASFERACPGAAVNRVIVLWLSSEPGWETGDLFAQYNFNVFLDSEFQFIATDPAFFGVRGIQGYLSGYCSEEQTRLFAKLVRHYAIEGNTRRFLDDPYVLPHFQNPDVTEGTAGWTLNPAIATETEQSISVRKVPGFGVLQAKYHGPEGCGDDAFITRRSGEKPNVISQQIRQLAPGRLYSLRFITGDRQELDRGSSIRRKHAITASISNAELLKEKCFQAPVASGFWHSYGGFNNNNPYWLNYHQIVFRAQSDNAELQLSDWSSSESAGGPDGEELLWNFIQLQPYFE